MNTPLSNRAKAAKLVEAAWKIAAAQALIKESIDYTYEDEVNVLCEPLDEIILQLTTEIEQLLA